MSASPISIPSMGKWFPPLELPPEGSDPVWWPANAGQQAFLNSRAELLMGGGASGGGKTQVLAADAVQEYKNPRLRALLIRRSFQEMQELEDIQQKMYEPRPYCGRWVSRFKHWLFPSGATIRPGYLAKDKDLDRYQGNPYSYLGIDETGQHPEHRIKFMIGWLAAPVDSGLFVRGRFTSNPGGIGHGWQMKVFLRNRCPIHSPATYADDRPYETSVYPGRIYRGACWTDDSPVYKTTSFIPFFLADNPFYGREKLTGLMSQSKALQQQLLYGCWCNAAGLYFDFMRPDDVVPYASIGDSWWWQHYMAIDYGYGNSAAAAGLYAVAPNGRVFKTRERIERKMPAKKFALNICKNGFDATDYPFQKPQTNWLKKLKTRDPEPPRMSFCVMDEAMDQHRGTGQSIYDVMSDVFSAHGVASMKAAHDPEGNAQVLYNGLSSGSLTLTRDSSDLPLTYRAVSSRIVDDRKAIKKIHGAWEDDCYDECLAEGTRVRTINGDFPIEEVHVGDLVLTRQGWRRVLWGGITQQNAEVVVATFSDGKKLIGTKNHPVFVEKKGFVRLNELKYGDKIFPCKSLKLSHTKESHSGVTQILSTGIIVPISLQEPQTEKTTLTTFIERFTKMFLVLFPKEWWSTTKTMIRRTMIQTTTNLSQRQSIVATMSSGDLAPRKELHGLENISELSGRLRSLGMGVRRGKYGIASAQRNTGNILLSKNSNAYAVEKNSSLTTQELTGSVLVSAVQSIGVILKSTIRIASARIVDQFFELTNIQNRDAVPVHVISLSTGEKGRVYNLTVDGCEEFFAEGVLVHNCSYAWNTWRQNSEMPARTALQQEIEEKRKEGVDETTLARIAWNREQAILADERKKGKGIRLGRNLNTPGKR